jgi:hypothetical protein
MTFTSPDYRNTVLVAGVGRSGTTWLCNLINYDSSYRLIFEPLHPEHGLRLPDSTPLWRYERPDANHPLLARDLNLLFTGQFENAFASQYTDNPTASRTLFKELRLSLLLPYIYRQFPGLPIVLIVRHPGAVVSSQLKLNWTRSEFILERMTSQPDLLNDHTEPFAVAIARARDTFERWMFVWCITQYVNLRMLRPGQVHWVFYESLVSDPLGEMRRLFAVLGRPFDEAALLPKIATPSQTTWNDNAAVIQQPHRWQNALTPEQIEIMHEILALFNLDTLYTPALQPDMAVFERLLSADGRPEPNTALLRRWRTGWMGRVLEGLRK